MKDSPAKFKKHIIRGVEVALVFGVAALIILYALGYYDLSFIDRDKIFGTGDTESSDTPFPGVLPGVKPGDKENDNKTPSSGENDKAPEDDGDSTPVEYATSTELVFEYSELDSAPREVIPLPEGYVYPEAGFVFDPSSSLLVNYEISVSLPPRFSRGKEKISVPEVQFPDDDSEKFITYTEATVQMPSVEMYMGYIMLTYGDGFVYICSPEGELLCKVPKDKYTPAYTRDRDGHPLFTRVNEEGETLYFYISDDGKTFQMCDYKDNRDNRGLYFDYPASYGDIKAEGVDIFPTYDAKKRKFAYMNIWGGYTTDFNYTQAYPYSEGLAAVTTENNRGGMAFISRYGYQPFYTYRVYANEHSRYVIENYLPPLTRGIESIGFFYFDHGLTRVRRQIIDYWNWDALGLVRVVSDEDILIRTDGTGYDIPAGYTLEGYSNGVLLLSKNGLYGFMSCTGEWIAQPIYKDAIPFTGGLGALKSDNNLWGVIDTEGNIILPFAYASMSQCSDGIIAAFSRDNKWQLFRIADGANAEN